MKIYYSNDLKKKRFYKKIINDNISFSLNYNSNKYEKAIKNLDKNKFKFTKKNKYIFDQSMIKLNDLKVVNPEIKKYSSINNLVDKFETKDYYNNYWNQVIFKNNKQTIKYEKEIEIDIDNTYKFDFFSNINYLIKINNYNKEGYLKISNLKRLSYYK